MVRFLVGAWRRAVRPIAELQLWEVLRRRGTRRRANQNPQALEFAIQRCTECQHPEECSRLLAAGKDDELEKICPNTMYLRHLDAMERHEPRRNLVGPDT